MYLTLVDTLQEHSKQYGMIFFLWACGSSEDLTFEFDGKSQSDSSTTEASSDLSPSEINLNDDGCDEVPPVTWENWTHSLMLTHCQGCHASTASNRYGAPINIQFDTEADSIDLADRIYIRVIQTKDMPPAGGILEDDLYLLDVWLRCSVGL